MSVNNVHTNVYWSSMNKLAHSGWLGRSTKIAEANPLAQFIVEECKRREITVQYDISYGGHPHELSFTECFGAYGGIYIRPCHPPFEDELLNHIETTGRDFSFLKQPGDKYTLLKAEIPGLERLVVLPGSNILRSLNLEDLKDLNRPGTFFKPHPITNTTCLFELIEALGEEAVLRPSIAGADLVRQAKEVVCTTSTEVGIYARLMGKVVSTLHCDVHNGGTYRPFYKNIDCLQRILGSHLSGVIFQGPEAEQQIMEYLDHYEKHLRNYSFKSSK